MTLLLRTTSNPTGYLSAVRDVVRKIDPGIALRGINTLEEEVADSIAIVRIMGILMGIFGVVALALSSLGVYGVLSESVAQRTHEIGIRLALGAKPRDLLKLILGQAFKLTGIGLVIAVPCAVAISRGDGVPHFRRGERGFHDSGRIHGAAITRGARRRLSPCAPRD